MGMGMNPPGMYGGAPPMNPVGMNQGALGGVNGVGGMPAAPGSVPGVPGPQPDPSGASLPGSLTHPLTYSLTDLLTH